MNVLDLIEHLQKYAAKSMSNAGAEVMLQYPDGECYGIAGANDAWGDKGLHLLIIVPDIKTRVRVKELKIQ